MIEWLPSFIGLLAACAALSGRAYAVVIGLLGVVASEVWKDGSLAPGEPLAFALCGLAIAPVTLGRFGQFWLAIVVAGALAPTGVDAPVILGAAGLGLIGVLAAGAQLDSAKAMARFVTIIAIWMASMALIELVQPHVIRGGAVDDLAASRGRVPLVVAICCGFCLWPLHSFLLAACRTGSAAAPFVLPALGLVTLNQLHLNPLIRDAVVGELSVLFVPLGLGSLCLGALLAYQEKDMRLQLVAAQVGLAGWSVALWFLDAEAGRLLWATAAVASTVMGAVISRLEVRYETRDRDSLRGLAKRHPTAAVVIGFSGIVLAKAAVGPLAMTRGLPVAGQFAPLAVVVVLLASLVYAAAFARGLGALLFGTPQFPAARVLRVAEDTRVAKDKGRTVRNRPLVGPLTLVAWGIPLVFVIVISVMPYNAERPQPELPITTSVFAAPQSTVAKSVPSVTRHE